MERVSAQSTDNSPDVLPFTTEQVVGRKFTAVYTCLLSSCFQMYKENTIFIQRYSIYTFVIRGLHPPQTTTSDRSVVDLYTNIVHLGVP